MNKESRSASRTIIASPRAIFRAFLDPEVIVKWRTPAGVRLRIHAFDARPGGGYRMELSHTATIEQAKSTGYRDIVRARFIEILPDERLVEAVQFESGLPEFAGIMTVTTTLASVIDGTKVTVLAEDVPHGILEADQIQAMGSSLKRLADFLE
nr:SRPBCC domain-containing protein [Sphingomonas laterariae]